MIPFRSLLSIAFVLATAGAAGCKEDPPPAKPDLQAPSASAKGKLNLRTPVAPIAKVDPRSLKEYRVDVCYFGTLTLKQARDSYLASLGKDEPSEKKIPSFGGAAAPPAPPTTPPKPDAKDTKPAPTAAAKDAKAPEGAARPKPDERKPFNFMMRAPHERNARQCTVATTLKEPAMPEIDPALAAFAPYAVELAKNIAAAQNYYQREEFKKDNFEKGKELHKKLVADFEKLDELHEKLGAALLAWREKNPPDLSKAEEGQKVATAAFEDGRAVLLGLIGKKIDKEAYRAAVKKLEASAEALKTYGTGHQADPWPKIMSPQADAYLRALKEAEPKITDKGVDPDAFIPVINAFTSLIEAKHRALSRWLISKGQSQTRPPMAPGAQQAAPPNPENRPVEEEPSKE
jgi:hypothetical protein